MILLAIAALGLGALHSCAPDHLATVSLFVQRSPSPRRALAIGVRWGLGHSLPIAVCALLLTTIRLTLSPAVQLIADRVASIVLIGLGVLAVNRAVRVTRNRGRVATVSIASRTHGSVVGHQVPDAALAMGVVHGLAGTGTVVATWPLALPTITVMIFLVSFSAGTVLSMATFSYMAGHMTRQAERRSEQTLCLMLVVSGLTAIGVGILWIIRGGAS